MHYDKGEVDEDGRPAARVYLHETEGHMWVGMGVTVYGWTVRKQLSL